MKKKHVTRMLTLVMAAVLIMSASITAFAASKNTSEQNTDAEVKSAYVETDSQNVQESDSTDESATVSGNSADAGDDAQTADLFANEEDVDSAKAGKEQKEKTETDTAGMSADNTRSADTVAKTGEFDMMPIIILCGLVALAAGGGYVVYRNNRK